MLRRFWRKWFFKLFLKSAIESAISKVESPLSYVILLKLAFYDEREYTNRTDSEFFEWLSDLNSSHTDYHSDEDKKLALEAEEHNPYITGFDDLYNDDKFFRELMGRKRKL